MRLLLIAPELKNDVIRSQQEALMRDIQSSELQATFLQGTVTRSDVIRELRSGRYDVLMAMTHGYAQGIQLSPGAWLEPQHLGTLATTIFGATFVLTVLISTKDHNRLWHAYSALLLLLTITTLGFALLRSEQMVIQEPMLSGLIRLMFIAMSCVAMSINVYIAWWLATRSYAHAETYR